LNDSDQWKLMFTINGWVLLREWSGQSYCAGTACTCDRVHNVTVNTVPQRTEAKKSCC